MHRKQKAEQVFRFRKHDTIGAAAAEDDAAFLNECFVETGGLAILKDLEDPRRIVVGNTGSGKTAILSQLRDTEDRVIEVRPESLALAHVSNSNILRFFDSVGVNLDIFFRLLWRHVFAIELLREHFNIRTEEDNVSTRVKLMAIFKDEKFRAAIEYLERWGKRFWLQTERRVKEVTTTLEEGLSAAVHAAMPGLTLSAKGADRLTESEIEEIVHRAQTVVNEIQIRQLSELIDLVAAVLSNRQKSYFIVIDKLDVDWVEDRIRYRLVRALIETVRDFKKVRHAKIVIAIRLDLLERVFRLTRDAGFQEEKYESLYLRIDWSKAQLVEFMDRRIGTLVRRTYTGQPVTHRDVLARTVRKSSGVDYILERTMMRPRDAILFLNQCIAKAADCPVLTSHIVTEAEGEYSRLRLRALADEWSGDYPNLIEFTELLKGRSDCFRLKELTHAECERFCLKFELSGPHEKDLFSELSKAFVDVAIDAAEFWTTIVLIMYKVGLVGLKLEAHEGVTWSRGGRRSISSAEVVPETRVYVHTAFWRTLGIRERTR